MKKLVLIALLFSGVALTAQETKFGIKGGFNYGATGDYETLSQIAGDASSIIDGEEKSGFHAGLFGQFEILGIFIRPELMYTQLNTEYKTIDYKVSKIDAPILVGVNILGPLNVKAGPAFQYIMKNELENASFDIGDPENKITLGYQLGAGIDIGKIGFDVRYEGAFKENNSFAETASDANVRIDNRPSQWILSLSLAL